VRAARQRDEKPEDQPDRDQIVLVGQRFLAKRREGDETEQATLLGGIGLGSTVPSHHHAK